MCTYDTGFVAPEMVKIRLCVVITPRLRRRRGLCSVVPLSTSDPAPVEEYHRYVEFERDLPRPWRGRMKWAKCDMIATVSYARLSPIGVGRRDGGKRRYIYPRLTDGQLKDIRKGVLCALALRDLTAHL